MALSPRINVTLDEDVLSVLTKEAEENDRSVAEVIRSRLRESVFGQGHERAPQTVGELAQSLLADGLTNDQVVAGVLDAFPDASTTKKSVAWYRSDMKKRGLPVLSQVEAKRRQAAKDKNSP